MITQIEIDGFKTFKDFKVELAPFQVIVGANGSGKSNLFDALQLLGRLAQMDVSNAFQDIRGEPSDVFTITSNGNPTTHIRLAVEMFVNPSVKDNLGREETLRTRRLRYEIEVERSPKKSRTHQLRIVFESLLSIPSTNDHWLQKYVLFPRQENWHISTDKEEAFIVTEPFNNGRLNESYLPSAEGYHIRFMSDGRGAPFSLPSIRTNAALQGVTTTEYPHVFAVHEELRSLQIFHVNPVMLRQPSSRQATPFLASDGKNMAAALFRMHKENPYALGNVSRDMANLVPGLLNIRVKQDKVGERYVIYADTKDKTSFPSHVLSEGTLRLLALATIKNDPQFQGIFCLEEPENGVSPLHLETMAHLLRSMATNFNDVKSMREPFRQVLLTTHSPLFISQPDVIDALLLAFTPTHIQGKAAPMHVTRMAPVLTSEALSHLRDVNRDDKAIGAYTYNTVSHYLDSELLEEAHEQIKKGRRELNER